MKRFPLNSVRPAGWLRHEMRRDLDGFVGNLDETVPEIIKEDDIYGKNRLTKEIKEKDVGSLNEGWDWEVQYLWWGAEQLGNWLDGLVRYAFLLDDEDARAKAKFYLDRAFAAQDPDGYLGIYAEDLRFRFNGENGELWAQTTIMRPALAYDAMSGKNVYRDRVIRAVERTMQAYPAGSSNPFQTTEDYSGLTHGLMFTDVLYELYLLTQDKKYIEYAAFLYENYCCNPVHDQDIFRLHLLDPQWRLRNHGAHVYEHIRAVITASLTGEKDYAKLIDAYFAKLPYYLQPSGGPIGDECIGQRCANATTTGYEYCSILELSQSYEMMFELTGDPQWADRAEHLVYNAGLAARHPFRSQISYLTCDNSYKMMGNGMNTSGVGENARYKYSSAHRDAAVCCVPNAGRLFPHFLTHMYYETQNGIFVALYGPSELRCSVRGSQVRITQNTNYPFENLVEFRVSHERDLCMELRIPEWAEDVTLEGAAFKTGEGHVTVLCNGSGETVFTVRFGTRVTMHLDLMGEDYFTVGGLVLSAPIAAKEHFGICYERMFRDTRYEPLDDEYRRLRSLKTSAQDAVCEIRGMDILNPPVYLVPMMKQGEDAPVKVEMQPIGTCILRRTTFPAGDERMD